MTLTEAITTGNYETLRQIRNERVSRHIRQCKTCKEIKDKVTGFYREPNGSCRLDCKTCYNKKRWTNSKNRNPTHVTIEDLVFCTPEQFLRVYFK